MVIVMAKLSVIPGKKEELFALARDVVKATQEESGCVSYTLLDDPSDPGSCLFVEEWLDLESLRKHTTTPHIAEWKRKNAELLAGKNSVKLYEGQAVKL